MSEVTEKPEEESADRSPFRGGLGPSFREGWSRIKYLQSSPERLVREDRIGSEKELEKVVEHYRRGKKVFLNLKERYGIAVPEMELLMGENEKGQASMFTVVDRIYGENVGGLKELPPEAAEKFERFYEAMARYYLDIYREGGDYWTDFGVNQLVYGRKKGEGEERVYIVDVGPLYFSYPGKERIRRSGQEHFQNNSLFSRFLALMRAVKETEGKFFPSRKLERARGALERIADSIDRGEVAYHRIAELKWELNPSAQLLEAQRRG